MDKKELYALIGEAMQGFGPFYQDKMRAAIQEAELPERWFGLMLARGFEPEPLTVDRYHSMFPYGPREQIAEALEELARLELMERVAEGAYRLADRGRQAMEDLFDAAHVGIAAAEPLPLDQMDRLNDLLRRIVEATLAAPEPAEKWVIRASRWTDPGEDAAAAVKTDQYLTDLLRYRDDAHVAAWQPYDVDGASWEVLTFVWREDANTPQALVEALTYRNRTAEEYTGLLAGLAERGWVAEEEGVYHLTEDGRAIREEAEEATDRYFFTGWEALGASEKAELEDLLVRLRDALKEAAGEE
jgi:hypothetical protein